MKKSVGCVVVVTTDEKKFVVALQRRGVQDSYPGACQVTVHGRVEESDGGEDGGFYTALIRESREELGDVFTAKCQENYDLADLIDVSDDKTEKEEVKTYAAWLPYEFLDLIRLERTSGGIDLVPAEIFFNEEVIEISSEHKKDGYPPSVRAMFPDEIKAVRRALEVFRDQVSDPGQ